MIALSPSSLRPSTTPRPLSFSLSLLLTLFPVPVRGQSTLQQAIPSKRTVPSNKHRCNHLDSLSPRGWSRTRTTERSSRRSVLPRRGACQSSPSPRATPRSSRSNERRRVRRRPRACSRSGRTGPPLSKSPLFSFSSAFVSYRRGSFQP